MLMDAFPFQTELEYDPDAYMRDREEVDCDFDSVNLRSSSDSHSYSSAPQVAFERDHPNGNFANTSSHGPGYEPELPTPPPFPSNSLQYTGAVWRPPNRQLQRHPSPHSPTHSHQLPDNHARSRERIQFGPLTKQVHETPEKNHITESKRRTRGEPHAPLASGGRSAVDPSASGPVSVITSNRHHDDDLHTTPFTLARQGVQASKTRTRS